MEEPSVMDLVVQLHSNLDSIHACVQSLSDTKVHDAVMEKLELERESQIRSIHEAHLLEAKELADSRKREEEVLNEQRRKEEEELMERRRREDEERKTIVLREERQRWERKRAEDGAKEKELKEKKMSVSEQVEKELERMEDEMERKIEEGKRALASLDEKRRVINAQIEAALSTPTVIPKINYRSRARTSGISVVGTNTQNNAAVQSLIPKDLKTSKLLEATQAPTPQETEDQSANRFPKPKQVNERQILLEASTLVPKSAQDETLKVSATRPREAEESAETSSSESQDNGFEIKDLVKVAKDSDQIKETLDRLSVNLSSLGQNEPTSHAEFQSSEFQSSHHPPSNDTEHSPKTIASSVESMGAVPGHQVSKCDEESQIRTSASAQNTGLFSLPREHDWFRPAPDTQQPHLESARERAEETHASRMKKQPHEVATALEEKPLTGSAVSQAISVNLNRLPAKDLDLITPGEMNHTCSENPEDDAKVASGAANEQEIGNAVGYEHLDVAQIHRDYRDLSDDDELEAKFLAPNDHHPEHPFPLVKAVLGGVKCQDLMLSRLNIGHRAQRSLDLPMQRSQHHDLMLSRLKVGHRADGMPIQIRKQIHPQDLMLSRLDVGRHYEKSISHDSYRLERKNELIGVDPKLSSGLVGLDSLASDEDVQNDDLKGQPCDPHNFDLMLSRLDVGHHYGRLVGCNPPLLQKAKKIPAEEHKILIGIDEINATPVVADDKALMKEVHGKFFDSRTKDSMLSRLDIGHYSDRSVTRDPKPIEGFDDQTDIAQKSPLGARKSTVRESDPLPESSRDSMLFRLDIGHRFERMIVPDCNRRKVTKECPAVTQKDRPILDQGLSCEREGLHEKSQNWPLSFQKDLMLSRLDVGHRYRRTAIEFAQAAHDSVSIAHDGLKLHPKDLSSANIETPDQQHQQDKTVELNVVATTDNEHHGFSRTISPFTGLNSGAVVVIHDGSDLGRVGYHENNSLSNSNEKYSGLQEQSQTLVQISSDDAASAIGIVANALELPLNKQHRVSQEIHRTNSGKFASLIDAVRSDIPIVSHLVKEQDVQEIGMPGGGHFSDELLDDYGSSSPEAPHHMKEAYEEDYTGEGYSLEGNDYFIHDPPSIPKFHARTPTADTFQYMENDDQSDYSPPSTPGRSISPTRSLDETAIRQSWISHEEALDHFESGGILKAAVVPIQQQNLGPFSTPVYPSNITRKSYLRNFQRRDVERSIGSYNSSPPPPIDIQKTRQKIVDNNTLSPAPEHYPFLDTSPGRSFTSSLPFDASDSHSLSLHASSPARALFPTDRTPPPPVPSRSPNRPGFASPSSLAKVPASPPSNASSSFFQKTRSLFESSGRQDTQSTPPLTRPKSLLINTPSPPNKPSHLRSRPSSMVYTQTQIRKPQTGHADSIDDGEESLVPRNLDGDGKMPSPAFELPSIERSRTLDQDPASQRPNSFLSGISRVAGWGRDVSLPETKPLLADERTGNGN